MNTLEPEKLLAMLRDPNVGSQEIADVARVSREDAARAARLATGMTKAKPEEILGLPEPLAPALIRAAFEASRLDVLTAAASHPVKTLAKEARRGLHILKARGVAVPESTSREPVPVPASQPEPQFPSYGSAIDGQGERAFWISRAVPGKGVEVGQVVISDIHGLIELQVGLLGRKEFRNFVGDLVARGQTMGVAEVGREHVLATLAAARRLNESSGHGPPDGSDAWLSRLGASGEPLDPSTAFPALPPDEEGAAIEDLEKLDVLPLMKGWIPEESALRPLGQKLDEIAVSPLYIDDRQRAEQVRYAVATAMEAYLDGERRGRLVGRLFLLAEHLVRQGEDAGARVAAATARAIRSGVEAGRIPLVKAMFARVLPIQSDLTEEPGAGEAPVSSSPLIVPGR